MDLLAAFRAALGSQIWGSIAVFAAMLLWWLQRRATRIGVEYSIEPRSLVTSPMGLPRHRQLRAGDTVLTNLQSVAVSIRNVGSMPIRPDDFHGPLTISAGIPLICWKARLVPKGGGKARRDIAEEWGGSEARISPLLLNPADELQVALFVEGAYGKVSVEGRIAGVPSLKLVERDARKRSLLRQPRIAYALGAVLVLPVISAQTKLQFMLSAAAFAIVALGIERIAQERRR